MSILSALANLVGGNSANTTLSPLEFKEAISDADAVLDVRTASEWKTGSIAGAKNIDVSDADFAQKVQSISREAKILVYCLSGGRSGRALSILQGMGFKDVRHLGGGIGSWKAAGYPVAK